MLEWFVFSFFGLGTESFLETQYQLDRVFSPLPKIEILQTQNLPTQIKETTFPALLPESESSVLILDVGLNKTLYEKDKFRSRNIASLSKLMTFWLIRQNYNLSEVVTVNPRATKTYGSQIELYPQERVTVKMLLEAILIPSANDAAKALAIFHSGSETEFAKAMNREAQKLGLKSARFYNATGLDLFEICPESSPDCDTKDYGNKMSAEDLAFLSRLLLKDQFFRNTVSQDHFYGNSVDEKFFHEKKSTNQLLSNSPRSRGLKTGYTELAGECFINLMATRGGDEFLTIILGSSDRFGETKKMADWVIKNFIWQ